jgi:uncharacterized protein
MDFIRILSQELTVDITAVKNIIDLLDCGNTIPFIARYRKESHGSLDDQKIRELSERLNYLRSLEKRKEEVKNNIEGQGKLTEEIEQSLQRALTLAEIEDIYRPYKQKRKTRASVAKEKGLEPLALSIFEQDKNSKTPTELATEFVNPDLGVETIEEALAGASDIIAEIISDNAQIRKQLREYAFKKGEISTKASNLEQDSVYKMYYDYVEPVLKIADHRILAIDRGEREEFLKVSLIVDANMAKQIIYHNCIEDKSPCTDFVIASANDAYSRLIFPSIEREVRSALTEKASDSAIKVFSVNLRQLLLQPPIKNRIALALDPAYRTGCKLAVVDETGKVLDVGVVYPTPPHNKIEEAKKTITNLIKKHKIEIIAIGNGTASKETEIFTSELIAELNAGLSYMVVSEAGASVYSASKLASEEFPEYDVSLRSAVSIARRLQDPLAELVKIDPKSIGVGQYQHDMPKAKLDESLSGVVEACVNSVGVDLNTASPSLLSYVSGINSGVSKTIVKYREENGAFKSRKELKKVPKLGAKAFEQSAGFLRVADSKNVLDNTAVHPESYKAAEQLLTICGYTLDDVKKSKITDIREKVLEIGVSNISKQLEIGEPTINDIITELLRPGRDPRDELPKPILRTDVLDMKDLKAGMELDGTVRNVIDFGAFIDIGVHQDGLVHISEICDRYIKHPSEVLKVGDIVKVFVMAVDVAKKRISLTMKTPKKLDI